MPAAADEDVAAFAKDQALVLVTEDRDFGRLVYTLNQGSHGVIYVRWPAHARTTLGPAVVTLVRQHGRDLGDAFVVLTPGRARIRRVRRE